MQNILEPSMEAATTVITEDVFTSLKARGARIHCIGERLRPQRKQN